MTRNKKEKRGKPFHVPGRWYERFTGEKGFSGDAADRIVGEADAIIGRIDGHLYQGALRLDGGHGYKDHGKGSVAILAGSISSNTPARNLDRPDERHPIRPQWSPEDGREYFREPDIAGIIFARARELEEKGKPEGKGLRLQFGEVAGLLREHRKALFGDNYREGAGKRPGLFALHEAVRDACRVLVKESSRQRPLTRILPASGKDMLTLLESRHRNAVISHLVRLGKIIHYQAADKPQAAAGKAPYWPPREDIGTSRYLTSAGQEEIKRTEAFVRVWRLVISLAHRTLDDWLGPKGKARTGPDDKPVDLLTEKGKAHIGGDQFRKDGFDRRLWFLFGDREDEVRTEDENQAKEIAEFFRSKLAGLRNSVFHFKGGAHFRQTVSQLARGKGDPDQETGSRGQKVAEALCRRDLEGRSQRVRDLLLGCHADYFLEQGDMDRLVSSLVDVRPGSGLPLPRFSRVLERAAQAGTGLKLARPATAERKEEAEEWTPGGAWKPGWLCQYNVTRLLYDRCFPAWLDERSGEQIRAWTDRAVEIADKAGRTINRDRFVEARAKILLGNRPARENIGLLLDMLMTETAAVFAVQEGYRHNREQAREQAAFVEKFRCDVIGMAFDSYLCGTFPGLRSDMEDRQRPADPVSRISLPRENERNTAGIGDWAGWPAVLYALLHLVPVDAVSNLRHQMRKHELLERKGSGKGGGAQSGRESGKDEAGPDIGAVLDLYIWMHDARFAGIAAGDDPARKWVKDACFESAVAFGRVFSRGDGAAGGDEREQAARRGVRETMRFGDRGMLALLFRDHRITMEEAEALQALEKKGGKEGSQIAGAQASRIELHREWEREGKKFSSPEKKEDYRKALRVVIRHRRLSNRVLLADHIRLHRLLVGVLARLGDYALLWERDLYFVTLALMYRHERGPRDVFNQKGQGKLPIGKIADALEKLKDPGRQIAADLEWLYHGQIRENDKSGYEIVKKARDVRDDLAHFNMLSGDDSIDLTEWTNSTRDLVSYDRKLKNAVSKSVIELMERDGIELKWGMKDHCLCEADIRPKRIEHLKGDRTGDGTGKIIENLHGKTYLDMVARLFGASGCRWSDDRVMSRPADSGPEKKR